MSALENFLSHPVFIVRQKREKLRIYFYVIVNESRIKFGGNELEREKPQENLTIGMWSF